MHPAASKSLWLIAFIVGFSVWDWDGVIVVGASLLMLKIILAGKELATAGPPEDEDTAHRGA